MASHDNDLFNQFSNIFVIAAINSFNLITYRKVITEKQFKATMTKNTDDKTGYFYNFILNPQSLIDKNAKIALILRC